MKFPEVNNCTSLLPNSDGTFFAQGFLLKVDFILWYFVKG